MEDEEDLPEFLDKMRGAIDQAFEFAEKQDEPAVMVYVVGTGKPAADALGAPGAIVHAVHGMSIKAIADAMISSMAASPEMPFSQALRLIVSNANLIKDHPALQGMNLSGDEEDDDGFIDGIFKL